jgi:hypothetical protein
MCVPLKEFLLKVVFNVVQPLTEVTGLARFYSLSYIWYTLFGTLVSIAIGLTVSLITSKSPC